MPFYTPLGSIRKNPKKPVHAPGFPAKQTSSCFPHDLTEKITYWICLGTLVKRSCNLLIKTQSWLAVWVSETCDASRALLMNPADISFVSTSCSELKYLTCRLSSLTNRRRVIHIPEIRFELHNSNKDTCNERQQTAKYRNNKKYMQVMVGNNLVEACKYLLY